MALSRPPDDRAFEALVARVVASGAEHYRDLPWRRTRDPYAVLVSEVMLQQTQVTRVVTYFEAWMESFPTLESLDAAPLEAVLLVWRGLGYNRRAIALKRAAEAVVEAHHDSGADGPVSLPSDITALTALPGIGPATAAGVRSFAFGLESAYLETNVRAVFLHEILGDRDGVSDRELLPLVTCAAAIATASGIDARTWNLALLDHGAHLKRTIPNPSRRSAHHVRQSGFEGSRRQRRSRLLRAVMDGPGGSAPEYAAGSGLDARDAEEILRELAAEGFVVADGEGWRIA